MSSPINYTLIIRNNGDIVPQVDDSKSPHGQFDRSQLIHIEQVLDDLRENQVIKQKKFLYFGELLYKTLIESVKGSFEEGVWKEIKQTQAKDKYVRLRIIFEEVSTSYDQAKQIINLPWEFLCYEKNFLGTDLRFALSCGYETWIDQDIEGYPVKKSPLQILFIYSCPKDYQKVAFKDKILELKSLKDKNKFEIKCLENPTKKELLNTLMEKTFDVFHFLGHGKPGSLALCDDINNPCWLEASTLSKQLCDTNVKLVVLQACEGAFPSDDLDFSSTTAQLVKTGIPAVVAFRYTIPQSSAYNFITEFYEQISNGQPVDVAVQRGRKQLSDGGSHDTRDFGAPILWMRLRDGLLFAANEQESDTPDSIRSQKSELLSVEDAKKILQLKELDTDTLDQETIQKLIDYCGGDTSLFKSVSTTIQTVFTNKNTNSNSVTKFLESDKPKLGSETINILDKKFDDLSCLQKEIMFWIAIHSKSYSKSQDPNYELQIDLIDYYSVDLPSAIENLNQNGLIKKYTLIPVVKEYIIGKLAKAVYEEIKGNDFNCLKKYSLVKAQEDEYLVEDNRNNIIKRIIEILQNNSEIETKSKLVEKLEQLKNTKSTDKSRYAGGNIINLLIYLEIQKQKNNNQPIIIKDYHFDSLICWHSYLKDVQLHDINFKNSHLEKCAFREIFDSAVSVAFTPKEKGEFLVTGDSSGGICFWDIKNAQKSYFFRPHDSTVWALDFNLDGSRLASCSADRKISLSSLEINDQNGELAVPTIYSWIAHSDFITAITFSPYPSMPTILASASGDTTIKLWDIQSVTDQYNADNYKAISEKGHSDSIHSLCFSPKGKILASGSKDKTIRLWNVENQDKEKKIKEICPPLKEHDSTVLSLAFSSDGKILASGSDDNTIRLWDVGDIDTIKYLGVCGKHSRPVSSVIFIPNTHLLASSSSDKTIKIWNIQDPCKHKELKTTLQEHPDPINRLAFSSDELPRLASVSNKKIKLWNVDSFECLRTFQGYRCSVNSVTFAPNSNVLVSAGKDDLVRFWKISSSGEYKILPPLSAKTEIISVAFNSIGNSLYLGVGYIDGIVKIYNVTDNSEIDTDKIKHESLIFSLAFSPSGKFLATCSEDRTVKLWDIQNIRIPKYLDKIQWEGNLIGSVAFHLKRDILASSSKSKGVITIWTIKDSKFEKNCDLTGHDGDIRALAFSPDGQQLVSGSEDKTLRIWNIETGEDTVLGEHSDTVTSIAFHPLNPKILVSASLDGIVKIWNLQTQECIYLWEKSDYRLFSIAFSPDGKFFASGGDDEVIRIWEFLTSEDDGVIRICDVVTNERPKLIIPKPYQGMNITGADGLTKGQKNTLLSLGAVDESIKKDNSKYAPKSSVKFKKFEFNVVTVNERGQEVNRNRSSQAKYFTENLGDNIFLNMVSIPDGKFIIGSPEGKGDEDEYPQQEVNISSFCIGQYPITQKQWKAISSLPKVELDLDSNPSHFKDDNRPVEYVSWFEAVEFCQRLSIKTGRDYRLPSEAEWEYACRAVTIDQSSLTSGEFTKAEWNEKYYQPFHFGETLTGDLANYDCATETYANETKRNLRRGTTPVGSFPPNAFGLYDLHGNVWEWCADHWHNNYQEHPKDERRWLSNNENRSRITRGGAWMNLSRYCRSAVRGSNDPRHRKDSIGFRVACSAVL